VALSRARLGLYILGRREVFETVPELRPAFDMLLSRPDKLQLVIGEMFDAATRTAEAEAAATEMDSVEHLGQYVYEMTQAKVKSLKEGREKLPEIEAGTGMGEDGGEDNEQDIVQELDDEEDLEDVAVDGEAVDEAA
jgi:intron-binding protein aquarius